MKKINKRSFRVEESEGENKADRLRILKGQFADFLISFRMIKLEEEAEGLKLRYYYDVVEPEGYSRENPELVEVLGDILVYIMEH